MVTDPEACPGAVQQHARSVQKDLPRGQGPHLNQTKPMNTDTMTHDTDSRETSANRDPLTGEPGSHPVGTGVGAAAGAASGAAIGAVGGPIGIAVGLVAGAVVGGLTGKAVAETVDPTAEDAYWRDNHSARPYAEKDLPYDAYRPAYRTGYEGYARYPRKEYHEVESDLQRDYEKSKGDSPLTWERAKQATRDAWHRVERALPGDADGDGR